MRTHLSLSLLTFVGIGTLTLGTATQSNSEPATEKREEFFNSTVRPLLVAKCFPCHTALKSGGLQMDSREQFFKGGNDGPVIVPGAPDQSLLVKAIRYTDSRIKMPPSGKLNDDEISSLEKWVRDGAVWSEASPVSVAAAHSESVNTPEQKAVPRFESAVQPLVRARCAACHDAKTKQAGLSVETRDDLLTGGRTGAAIVPGRPAESLLLGMITTGKMPMGGPKLSPEEIATIRRWIEAGALKEGEEVIVRPVAEREIFTIVGAKCFVCHGRTTQDAGLDLRSVAGMLKGGKSGPAIIPGQPEKSLLIQRVQRQEMPPPKLQEQFSVRTVDSAEFEKLKQWIAQGARPDNEEPLRVDVNQDPLVKSEDRQFWSFRPPVRPAVPRVASGAVHNPIDAFLLQTLADKHLSFAPEAGRLTLMRRAYMDLLGVPPTPEEAELYIQDKAPDAYERLIDRLLASPKYGERWARYWLDAAGYTDSEGGVSADTLRASAWRYRDYVIRALNSDKPYDQFLSEQLAGDEMFDWKAAKQYTPDQAEKLAATGFLRLAPDSTYSTEQNFMPDRFDHVASEMQVLGSAVLGLTLGCARCHNHKFDPLPQRDYYRVSAVFQTALDPYDWRVPSLDCIGVGAKCEEKNTRFIHDPDPQLRREFDDYNAPIKKQIAAMEQKITDAAMPYREKSGKKDASVDELAAQFPDLHQEVEQLRKELEDVRAKLKVRPDFRALFDMGGEPTPTRILLRGDVNNPGPLVEPGPPSVLAAGLAAYRVEKPAFESDTSGRRLAFARWLTQPAHPLTARVIVNRIWLHHFGAGIVRTPGNFGKTGAPPTHPELLDWLATEFVQKGWSMKAMHRLIMTSSAYRQSSRVSEAAASGDPSDALLSRFPMRRLDAEALRDSLFYVAGRLDGKMFGPPAEVKVQPDGMVLEQGGEKGYRRSIYLTQRRSTPVTILDSFDAPIALMNPNCVKRGESTVSSQALQLMNGEQVFEAARYLAARIIDSEGGDARKQVERLYLATLTRRPTAAELEQAVSTLQASRRIWQAHLTEQKPAEPVAYAASHMALASLCHTFFNCAEFIYEE